MNSVSEQNQNSIEKVRVQLLAAHALWVKIDDNRHFFVLVVVVGVVVVCSF
jgi:hypothetical protein